jgi:o-succinylbenzoate synthase
MTDRSVDAPAFPAPTAAELAEILATAEVFALPLRNRFRGITVRDGMLLRGPSGWAEFAPFHDYSDRECVPWLRSALEAATVGWPAPLRASVPVNVTVPEVDPERAAQIVTASGASTAKVKVAGTAASRLDFASTLAADRDRLAAVRRALGPAGSVRIDANGRWSVREALDALAVLDGAAGGLQYVEQPCRTVDELAEVRRRTTVPVAADESIRLAGDPERVVAAGAADVAVLKVAPLGGVRAALRVAGRLALPVVVSSALDSAVGMAAGLALAGALPALDLACGLGTGSMFVADVSSTAGTPVRGTSAVPLVAPEPDRLPEVRAEADLTAFWHARLARVAALL